MKKSEELWNLVGTSLATCNAVMLPRLWALVRTEEGMESAQLGVYNLCATQGISVQTAMSLYDTELPTETE